MFNNGSAAMSIKNPHFNPEKFLTYATEHDFGDVHFKFDNATGLHAIVAIHSTHNGPALGGCRFVEYTHWHAGLYDAMRLARAMSYKAAIVNLPLGGGKSVLLKPPHPIDRQAYFAAFGKFVDQLAGRYITAVDVGSTDADMRIIQQHTPYVAIDHLGEPSTNTALGVIYAMQAAVKFKLKRDDLAGLHVAIQGVGKVGYDLARRLHQQGVKLTVADVDTLATQRVHAEFAADIVAVDDIHKIACDIFCPCALGATINPNTIQQLQTGIIVGSANNQLDNAETAALLFAKNILYAPDYLANAGGLIYAANRYADKSLAYIEQKTRAIYDTLLEVLDRSQIENKPTSVITDTMAKERLS